MTTTQIISGIAIVAITALVLATVGPNPAVVVMLVCAVGLYLGDLGRTFSRSS
jgi:hypothetical protein